MTKNDKDDKKTKVDEVENQKVEEVEEVKEESKEKEKIAQLENQLKRALADYQNLEKRMVEERRSWIQQANKGLLLRILPALDTLELALKHSQDKGVHLAVGQIVDSFKSEGVEKIKTVGNEFDPYTMECVQTIDGEDGKVLEEVRSGYTLYDKVIRPAQVVVGNTKS